MEISNNKNKYDFPTDIWNIIKTFLWHPMVIKIPGILYWFDYNPIACNPEFRKAINNVYLAHKSLRRNELNHNIPNNAINHIPNNAINHIPNNAINHIPNTINHIPNNAINHIPNAINHTFQKKSLMSFILCEKCLKMKQDYRLPYCNKCLPNNLAITVTYKYNSNGHSLKDLRKEPVFYKKEIINIKHLLGFKIPKSHQSKYHTFIKSYQLPTIPPIYI